MRKRKLWKSRRTHGTQKGFTLIEVLITLFMLGITLLTMLSIFMYGFTVVTRSRQVNVATQIINEELEYLRTESYDELLLRGTGFLIKHDYLEELDEGNAYAYIYDGPGEDIKEISVTVEWKYKGRKMHRTVATYVTRTGINKR